jgi:hypothetical protein
MVYKNGAMLILKNVSKFIVSFTIFFRTSETFSNKCIVVPTSATLYFLPTYFISKPY